jgi:hypothetical protein
LFSSEKATNNSCCVKIIHNPTTTLVQEGLFARKEQVAKRNKMTLNSLWRRKRMISADIG